MVLLKAITQSILGQILNPRTFSESREQELSFGTKVCRIYCIIDQEISSLEKTASFASHDCISLHNTFIFALKMIEHVWTIFSVFICHHIIGTSHVCGLSHHRFPNIAQHVGLDCTQSMLSVLTLPQGHCKYHIYFSQSCFVWRPCLSVFFPLLSWPLTLTPYEWLNIKDLFL